MANFIEKGVRTGAHLATQQMVTHSRFFSSEFNTAIIDGPLRIYFADRQESDALQIYFNIQESLAESGIRLDSIPSETPQMFLMLYPNKQTFIDVFDAEDGIAWDQFGEHRVVGVQGPCEETTRKIVVDGIRNAFEGVESRGHLDIR
jgi:hypothetical protein